MRSLLTRSTQIGLAAVAVVLVVAGVDYSTAKDRYDAAYARRSCVPPSLAPSSSGEIPPSPSSPPTTATCVPPGYPDVASADSTEQAFHTRIGLYVVALTGVIGLMCAGALRRRPQDQAEIFNNLGVAGVASLIVIVIILVGSDFGHLAGATPLLLPAVMFVGALLGRLFTTPVTKGDERVAKSDDPLPAETAQGSDVPGVPPGGYASLGRILLAQSAIAVAVAFLLAAASPDCNGGEGHSEVFDDLAMAFILGGLLLALVCLMARRWIAAGVGLVLNVIAAFLVSAGQGAFC